MNAFRSAGRGRRGRPAQTARVVPRVERLETRTLPAIHVLGTTEGINRDDAFCNCEPPDTDVAVGPGQFIETVNLAISFYDKGTGNQLLHESLKDFFAPVGTGQGTGLSDPVVTYDDLAGRFFVLVLEYAAQHTYVSYAVSNTANPLDGFADMHRYETTVTLPDGTKLGSDYPKLGYNAEAYVVTLNMDLINGAYVDPVQEKVLTIDKATQKLYDVDVDVGSTDPVYAMAPATMHGAPPGSPLYAVRETTRFGGDSVRVIAMTDLLSDHPTFTEYVIPIFPYTKPPPAVHPPFGKIETFESFFLNADWRDNRLVATFHIGLEGDSVVHVAWFDFDTSGAVPVLTQSGILDQGPGVHTYFSAIAVAANGDLGLTFMESSATELISMYVTGQPAFAYGTGKMVPPVAVAVGQEDYGGSRGGDYAGMAVDPEMGDVFWAANEYKPDGAISLWGTRIASFVLERDSTVAGLRGPLTDGLRIAPSDNRSAMRVPTAGQPTAAATAAVAEAPTVEPVGTTTAPDRSFMVRVGPHSAEALGADEWSAVLDDGAWSLGGRRPALAPPTNTWSCRRRC